MQDPQSSPACPMRQRRDQQESSGMTRSAGILVYDLGEPGLQVLLAHPGGPFWRNKDLGAWMIPKGEIGQLEEPLAAALREFTEETGATLSGDFIPLGELQQKGGKQVIAFACRAALDPETFRSNNFEMEWPPRSGRLQSFPEIDRAAWFDMPTAQTKILPSQRPFLDRLADALQAPRSAAP
jgi:predicted NUDIX family NTP pyrophosphohydrolase